MQIQFQKVIAGFLSACLAASIWPAIPIVAAQPTEITVETPSYVQAGSSFDLEIHITGNPGFASSGFVMELGEVLIPNYQENGRIDARIGSGFTDLVGQAHYNADTDLLSYATMGSEDCMNDGMIAAISMYVPEDIADGSYTIPFTVDKLNTVSRDKITATVPTSFTIKVGVPETTTTESTTTTETTTTTESTTKMTKLTTTTTETTAETSELTTTTTESTTKMTELTTTTTETTTETTELTTTTTETTTETTELTTTTTESTTKMTELTTTTTEFTTKMSELTTTTTESTTTEPPKQTMRFYAAAEDGCPEGALKVRLMMDGNVGLGSLGVKLTLPDVLKPKLDKNGKPILKKTEALNGMHQAVYNAEKNIVALDFVGLTSGKAMTELCTLEMLVSDTAVIGTEHSIAVFLDSFYTPDVPDVECVCEGSAGFTISEPPARVLSKTEVTLTKLEDSVQLELQPKPDSLKCTWKSADETIVTVDASGKLTAHANGKTTVSVLCQGKQYDCTVTVAVPRTLNFTEIANTVGASVQLVLSPEMSGAVSWYSSNEAVATVSQTGLVTIHAIGTAAITAESGGVQYVCQVTGQEYQLGDVNFDGVIDADDSNLALLAYLEETVLGNPMPLTNLQFLAADYDCDGVLTADDATLILQEYLDRMMG